ncbi:amidohydrolase [Streptomyces sp. Edi2]|uniref:amidohydrolase n=1 Tax=Streptomyces sp. Edi2 TaxID=3162528 RepID=UPI003306110C
MRLHSEPELSGGEQRTAARAATVLRSLGCRVTEGIGGHGVVGALHNGPGPMVLLRAELDALPVREETELPYASTVTAPGPNGALVPVAHACGHDAHLAAALGATELLARHRDRWSGTVLLVGQASEETLSGAAAMLADGLYERFGTPDAALAQHLAPFPAGVVAHGRTVLAASRVLRIVLNGSGGHAAYPKGTANPIEAAAAVVAGLCHAVGPEVVAGVGTLHAGTTVNVLPDQATLEVGIRAPTEPQAEAAEQAIAELARREAKRLAVGHPPEITVTARSAPTVNHPQLGATVRTAHAAVLGPAAVQPWRISMATEDFPEYAAGGTVPTVYWMLGCVGRQRWESTTGLPPKERFAAIPPNHSPRFAPDPVPTLSTGIVAMATAALACGLGDVSEM